VKPAEPAAGCRFYAYSTHRNHHRCLRRTGADYVASQGSFERPTGMPDGKNLIFNRTGTSRRLLSQGGTPQIIDTDSQGCNNDHGISPDGTHWSSADNSQKTSSRSFYRANPARRASGASRGNTFVLGMDGHRMVNAGLCRRKEW